MKLYNISPLESDKNLVVSGCIEFIKISGIETEVCFGKSKGKARVFFNKDLPETEIKISKKLIDNLMIKTCCSYQLKVTDKSLEFGPVLGFLLGEQSYLYHNNNLSELTDSLENIKYGGLYLAFKASNIDWTEKKVYGLYFNPDKKYWFYGVLPLPQVIFRRAFSSNKREIKKIIDNGIEIFNSRRLDKWQTYIFLRENELSKYLPNTERLASIELVTEFLKKHTKIVLKPANLSRGRGICFLELDDDGKIFVNDYRGRRPQNYYLDELNSFIKEGKFIEQGYIIQEYIRLLSYAGVPFDVRVIVQKNKYRTWEVTGKECRLPASKGLVTNLARGGKVLELKNIFDNEQHNLMKLEQDINNLAISVANQMDFLGENFGEFGLDIAIDQNLKLWLIEVNFRPTYKGFKILDKNKYFEIASKPLKYAISLSGFEIWEVRPTDHASEAEINTRP
ncbi:YheC/D like ATP-grasp [Carboxydocella sporoproducens DSM 16521]|uniref:YheC/D like ATP-grasp n=2 Tax=Carboxydocella TaxID=178898 RepID=A0A1T4PQ36_9FIRM|nr:MULTISPECIES: YheC/YheD family protein [Carboxydocella]AVX19700.1 YheC/D like ATP-grasp [Carboxydocella thermautotrophica]SJZ93692.1 YheC/D like ATP-grasp [Carboxydocella sporoproducens DSM 16521]